MGQQRKQLRKQVKVRIALEAIRGQRTINEIAAQYEVHPNLVSRLKRQALDGLADVLEDKRRRKREEVDAEALFKQIGQLTMEVEFLKKKLVDFR